MMLYLVRHGIAIDRDDPACPAEAERYLTEEGLKRTREAARGIRRLLDRPATLLSSFANVPNQVACARFGDA